MVNIYEEIESVAKLQIAFTLNNAKNDPYASF
jgi:hypothetical protein